MLSVYVFIPKIQNRHKDKELRAKKKIQTKKRSGTRIKKNIKHKRLIEFQVKGSEPLKFCRTIQLTEEVRQLFGQCVHAIVPKEAKQDGRVPWLSLFRHTKGRFLVLRCDVAEREDTLKLDENGNAYLEPDVNFTK